MQIKANPGGPLLSYEEARAIIEEKARAKSQRRRLQVQVLPLSSCLGKVLAAPLVSPEALPYFRNAQMDGFAIAASATQTASPAEAVLLPILGAWAAGDVPEAVQAGGAYEVTTGTMMPGDPYDAVVKVEDVEIVQTEDGKAIRLTRPLQTGEFVRFQGEDFQIGQELAKEGTIVSAELIMACASLGIAQLPVHEAIRIALIATGKELQRYSDKDLRQGSVRDASGPYLEAILKNPMFDLVIHKVVPDDPEIFTNELNLCLEMQPDIILSTGAVSMGRHDFVHEVIQRTGGQVYFHKVAVRPGKPILFAEWGDRLGSGGPVLFGLPGNPISTLIGWRFFVETYFRALLGRPSDKPRLARLQQRLDKPAGFACFFKARLEEEEASLKVQLLPGQASHLISPLLQANVWLMLPAAAQEIAEGTLLPTFRLSSQEVFSHD